VNLRSSFIEFVQQHTIAVVKLTGFFFVLFALLRAWSVTAFYWIALDLARLAAFSPSSRDQFSQRSWTRHAVELGENHSLQIVVVGGMLFLAVAYATTCIGFSRLKKWARRPAMVLACLWLVAGVTFKWFFGIGYLSFVVEVVYQGLFCWWIIWLLRQPEVKREFGVN